MVDETYPGGKTYQTYQAHISPNNNISKCDTIGKLAKYCCTAILPDASQVAGNPPWASDENCKNAGGEWSVGPSCQCTLPTPAIDADSVADKDPCATKYDWNECSTGAGIHEKTAMIATISTVSVSCLIMVIVELVMWYRYQSDLMKSLDRKDTEAHVDGMEMTTAGDFDESEYADEQPMDKPTYGDHVKNLDASAGENVKDKGGEEVSQMTDTDFEAQV